MTHTRTRTHTFVQLANPYLVCEHCGESVPRWHAEEECGCSAGDWNEPCRHPAGTENLCPSWSPVDGCTCQEAHNARGARCITGTCPEDIREGCTC